ncbi:hypothetical protein P7C73_g5944, partial [Tremellales sp. Uapishka_1]
MSIQSLNTNLPSGAAVHYLSSGPDTAPVLLLLHGFPTSCIQYKELITQLAPSLGGKYRLLAPDLPGFGETTVPSNFTYTFAALADVIGEWLDALSITSFSAYIFDYGAPTAFRLALARPKALKAIITQNGNAYEEGLGDFWAPLQAWWATGDANDAWRNKVRGAALTVEATKAQYLDGVPRNLVDKVPASAWEGDYENNIKGKEDIQLDLFFDYRKNVELYPRFQQWMRESGVRVLAVWGKNDIIFTPPGAEAFKRDVKDTTVVLLDGGHFLLETHVKEVAQEVARFLKRGDAA